MYRIDRIVIKVVVSLLALVTLAFVSFFITASALWIFTSRLSLDDWMSVEYMAQNWWFLLTGITQGVLMIGSVLGGLYYIFLMGQRRRAQNYETNVALARVASESENYMV